MRTQIFRKIGSTILSVFIFLVHFSAATAVQFYSDNVEDFYVGDPPRIIFPITITAESDGEITAEFGIRIKSPDGLRATFDRDISEVSFSGSAVENSAVVGTPDELISFSHDLRNLDLTVARDFRAGESLVISGLKIRVYNTGNSARYLELHLDDSGVYSARNVNGIRIDDATPSTDTTAPYPVDNLKATQISAGRVQLSWTNPPDLDTNRITILRTRVRDGSTRTGEFDFGVNLNTINQPAEFLDDDVAVGDELIYELHSRDSRNSSDPVSISITLVENFESDTDDSAAEEDGDSTDDENDTDDSSGNGNKNGSTEQNQKAIAAGISDAQFQNAVAKYSDLDSDHWSAGFLARLNSDKIIDGYPDGTIRPDTTINRVELAKIVANSFSLESADENFTDVDDDAWFAGFVGALQNSGASWTNSAEFFPAAGVARGEAVWTILTAAGVDIPAITEKPFPDVSTAHPYSAAIAFAKNNSIISGYEDGTFGITDTLTRAQVAKIIVLLENYLAQ